MPVIKKVVLIGAKDSPYISSRGMRKPRVVVRGDKDVRVLVTVCDTFDGEKVECVVPSGDHEIGTGSWMKASVIEGDHTSVFCTIVSAA